MKRKILFLIMLSIWLIGEAAKPIEVVIDSISYQLNIDTNEFYVVGADKSIHVAQICDSIEYDGLKIPVTNIQQAFCDCVKLDSVAIPETILEIGKYAFGGCTNLTSIILPSSINTIRDNTFVWSGLKYISIPESVRLIEKEAFYHCSKLEKVVFNGPINEIQEGAFCTYGFGISEDKGSIKEVYIPSLTDWMNIKFGTNDANPLSRNNSYLYIENKLIEDLVIYDNFERISDRAFLGCGSLKKVEICDSVEYIGKNAFSGCPFLQSVELGKSIKEIMAYAFADCPALTTIRTHSIIPPILKSVPDWETGEPNNAFYNSYPEFITLHVPEGTKDAYENADGWKDFGTIIDDIPNDSGVYDVFIDESKSIEVYNLNGTCVYSGTDKFEVPSGLYIVRQGNITKKVIIK